MENTVGDIGATETVKFKTVELKVSVHCKCEGCHIKVTKVIQSVKGVNKTEVDLEQNKVVVKCTEDFDTNILIQKLQKKKKPAEILHESITTAPELNDMKDAKKKTASSSGNKLNLIGKKLKALTFVSKGGSSSSSSS
ncbi:hypothetical protein LIER_38823 [Lithospermum erythrorhizon]|uniref:HMA domain-containing protein n=1 Tax=Lithospermum erythrorhizon TaxID=34254 RepID=A0AAV3Q7Q7_LITER